MGEDEGLEVDGEFAQHLDEDAGALFGDPGLGEVYFAEVLVAEAVDCYVEEEVGLDWGFTDDEVFVC